MSKPTIGPKIGIIGYGYWGQNLVRNFHAIDSCELTTVADDRPERLALMADLYPSVKTVRSAQELIQSPEVDAVVIATPVFLHYSLAKLALQAGKHVLVEKPMTASLSEADELISLAQSKQLLLMVDHTFLYTGAVRKIKQLVEAGELGNINYVDSTRVNLGLFQPDINVLWDLAPHDISILNHLTPERPVSVNATGVSHTGNGIENMAYLTLNYQSNMIAHFSCSWASPLKLRNYIIGGDKKMVLYDDIQPSEKVKVYDTGYRHEVSNDEEKRKILVDYRTGDIYSPHIEQTEALKLMAEDFCQSIITQKQPLSDALVGRDVVAILEAAQKSIKQNGAEIKL